MASTYTPENAITLARNFIHKINVDEVGPQICDMINSIIWRAFFWRWSVKAMTAIPLVDGQQDYPSTIPADFYRFRMPRIARTDQSPVLYREVDECKWIGVERSRKGGLNDIKDFTIQPEISGIRLMLPPLLTGTVTMEFQAEYQYVPTKITDANLKTAFLFPDHYYNVMIDGMWWKFYQFADDPRAGSITINREGQMQATGQIGIFIRSLGEMIGKEDIASGQEGMFPSDTIGWSKNVNPGLFGFTA